MIVRAFAALSRHASARSTTPLPKAVGYQPEAVAAALYRGILGREPDAGGLADKIAQLAGGSALDAVVRDFVASPEFRLRMLPAVVPPFDLPDLTRLMPQMYEARQAGGDRFVIYTARTDADIDHMARLIESHRYYDRFGVWSPLIDRDKEVTAGIVRALGARSCFELGCFTGPVLSLLAEAGIGVAGADVSHTAFTFAYPNIRDALLYGDLLHLDIDRRFDVVLAMDVLEHINPLLLDRHVARLAALLNDDGYLYVNSPMFGDDAVFGTVFHPVLEEWRRAGDGGPWRHWLCDDMGWPQHGHLVWASVAWWERTFAAHGLVRDEPIERAIHRALAEFFAAAPARRSLFVLRRPENRRAAEIAAGLEAQLRRLMTDGPSGGAGEIG